MSSLSALIESLTKEKDKLVQMGDLKTSKDHALEYSGSTNSKYKGKQKLKEKRPKSDDEESYNST